MTQVASVVVSAGTPAPPRSTTTASDPGDREVHRGDFCTRQHGGATPARHAGTLVAVAAPPAA